VKAVQEAQDLTYPDAEQDKGYLVSTINLLLCQLSFGAASSPGELNKIFGSPADIDAQVAHLLGEGTPWLSPTCRNSLIREREEFNCV
jgi:hypothetical protein